MKPRTKEHEERRLAAVRAALKGHPATQAQREARTEGLRRAWAEGRITAKPRTIESIQKGADALRGRKRPPEVVEKIRLIHLGSKRSAKAVENIRAAAKIRVASGHQFIPTKEQIDRMVEARRAKVGWKRTPQWCAHHSEVMTGRKRSRESVEKAVAKLVGREQVKPLVAKGPQHWASVRAQLRSPMNVVYDVVNLRHFVRTHEHLFEKEKLNWDKGGSCRATKGLASLMQKNSVFIPGSWFGWTLVSKVEKELNHGRDLLDRPRVS